MADTNITRRQFTNLSEPQQLRELNRQMEWIWHQLLGGLTEKALSNVGIKQTVKRIENTVAENLDVDTLRATTISAAIADFMVENVTVLNADLANLNDLQAAMATLSRALIGVADIDIGHIKRMSTDTAFIREEVGGKAFIDDLAVTDANIVNLAAGTILLNNSNGSLVELYVDDQGVVQTRSVSYDGSDIINQNTLNGNRILQNSITADRLNVSEMFALNSTIMNLIADHIDASRINVGKLKADMIEGPRYNPDIVTVSEYGVDTLEGTEYINDDNWVFKGNDIYGFLFNVTGSDYSYRSGTVTAVLPNVTLLPKNFWAEITYKIPVNNGGTSGGTGSGTGVELGSGDIIIQPVEGTVSEPAAGVADDYTTRSESETWTWNPPIYNSKEEADLYGEKDASGDVIGIVKDSSVYPPKYIWTARFDIPPSIVPVRFFQSYKLHVDFSSLQKLVVKFDDQPGVRHYGKAAIGAGGLSIGDFTVNGSGNVVSNGSLTSNGTFTGANGTFTGQLVLSNTTDVGGSAASGCALIIGNKTGTHLALDGNEIMAKTGNATVGNLSLNFDGGNVQIGAANATYNVQVRSTQASTSKTTGALVVGGGVGVGGTVYANAFNGPLTGNVTGNISGYSGTGTRTRTSLVKGTNPSSTTWQSLWYNWQSTGSEQSDRVAGAIESYVNASGLSALCLRAYQFASGSTTTNTMEIKIAKDGTCSYGVSNPAAFRTAIGAGTSSLVIGTTATTAMAGNTNVTQARQGASTSSKWRKILLGATEYDAYNTDVGDTINGNTLMAKSVSVQPSTGKIQAAGFVGPLTGNVTGNCSGTAGAVAWGDVTGKPSTFAPTIGTTATTAAAGNHTHSYLPLSGGTLTGSLTTNGGIILRSTATASDVAYRTITGGATNNSTWTSNDVTYTVYAGDWGNLRVRNRYKSVSSGTTTWVPARIEFRAYSATANSGTHLNYYDAFALPGAADGKTANNTYSILTSKAAVTVAQGGTGATTGANAIGNLYGTTYANRKAAWLKTGILTKTVNKKTDSNGNVDLEIDNTEYMILSIIETGEQSYSIGVIAYANYTDSSYRAHCFRVNTSHACIASANVSLDVVYAPIPADF